MVEEVLLDNPDLANAKSVIFDFSAAGPKQPRMLKVIDAREIPCVASGVAGGKSPAAHPKPRERSLESGGIP